MKKEIKILLGFVVVIIVLLLSFYLASINRSEKAQQTSNEAVESAEVLNQVMTNEEKANLGIALEGEYEILSRDIDGKILSYKVTSTPSTLQKIPVKIDWMSEAEIAERKLNTEYRYQVLERDEAGVATAYKVVLTDNDVLIEYGQYTYSE